MKKEITTNGETWTCRSVHGDLAKQRSRNVYLEIVPDYSLANLST